MLAIGCLVGALDVAVPLVGSRIIDLMAAARPFGEVARTIVVLTVIVWVPHGNLLPYLLESTDIRAFRIALAADLAAGLVERALRRSHRWRDLRPAEAQAILLRGREAIVRVASVTLRQIPNFLRAVCVLALVAYMAPAFVPFLLVAGVVDLLLTLDMGRRLAPRWRTMERAEDHKRRLETELLASRFGAPLPSAEARAAAAPFRVAAAASAAAEMAAELPALRYKLARDLVVNGTNVVTWIAGAWYVLVAGHGLGSFVFFVAWSSRANELFGAAMLIQGEAMKARPAVERLVRLVGPLEPGDAFRPPPTASDAMPAPATDPPWTDNVHPCADARIRRVDALLEDIVAAVTAAERAAVVRWLRDRATGEGPWTGEALREAAHEIESGEHIERQAPRQPTERPLGPCDVP